VNYDDLLKDKDAQELTESNILKKVSDLKYYLMIVAFLGIGYLVITKVQKK
tara:strand:+ start:384 stop:536 length:153 start_codon:yes stop_codon:yes gene_type:complete